MPNWVICGHGHAHKKAAGFRARLTGKYGYGVTVIPPSITLVVYTPQNSIMGMNWGWHLWDQLGYGLKGGERAAFTKDARHKIKKPFQIVPDYRITGDPTFPCGVFTVGGCTDTPHMAIPPGGELRLSDVLKAANKAKGVQRVYWLCCTFLDATAQMFEMPSIPLPTQAPAVP
jgi:hypothetical protein